MPAKLSEEIVIQRMHKIHNHKYSYPNFNYINRRMIINIVCPVHGIFQQTINCHIYKKAGCPKCKNDNCRKIKRKSFKYFKEKANIIHDFFYDYSKAEKVYLDSTYKIPIVCPKHGTFYQTFRNHVNSKAGCPKCRQSKGELLIYKWLKDHNIKFKSQKTFLDCKGVKNKLPFDFYLPKYNICIEYDGKQHFEPVCFNGINFKIANENFKKLKINDKIKTNYCQENNIILIRISYKDNVASLLSTILQEDH